MSAPKSGVPETTAAALLIYRIRIVSGEQRWVWEQGAAVYSQDGAVTALEGFITDITDLKVAQEATRESELRFRSLFEASSIGTAIVGLDGRVLQANSALGRFLGCDAANLTGKSIADVSFPDDYATDAQLLELLLAGEVPSYTIEKRYVTQTGEVTWGLLTASLVRDLSGAPQFLIGQVQDINERKAVQAELEQLYQRTQLDTQEKSVLINEINHRVKNNLMAILGLLLAEQQFAQPEQRVLLEEHFENIARRIKGLIEVHRFLSESEWASPEISELVSHLIHAALDALSLTKQVSVQVVPSSIRVTPRQASNLTIVINELLANSLKHALINTAMLQVSVTMSAVNDMIHIEYRDNGDGYPVDVLRQEQQGVGLYLVRRIVERTLRGKLATFNDNGAVTQIVVPVDTIKST